MNEVLKIKIKPFILRKGILVVLILNGIKTKMVNFVFLVKRGRLSYP